jgi:hypothetical protein
MTVTPDPLAEDATHDLRLYLLAGKLYVLPAPDAEPLAVFDAQEVLAALEAERGSSQTQVVALVAIASGHSARRFGGRPALAAAYTLLAAAEALAAARLVLPPDSGVESLAALLQNKFRLLFDAAAAGQRLAWPPFDPAALATARAAVAVPLAVAAEAGGRRLLADALAHADAALQRGIRKDAPC